MFLLWNDVPSLCYPNPGTAQRLRALSALAETDLKCDVCQNFYISCPASAGQEKRLYSRVLFCNHGL